MGLVDFSPVAAAPVVHVPTPFYFGMPKFELSSIIMMCIIATVSMVESTGVYLALSDITKDPIDSTLLRNGYRAEGMAVLLGGLFNTFPYTGFSQNVGLVKLSGIKKRLPIYYTAGFLVLLGLLPKFGALAQIIPSPVLGGAMLVMFGFVSIQGMQILARVDFANNEHNFLIAAVSIAAGVGLNNSNLFNSLPTAGFLVLLGLLPKFGALSQIIPSPVLGGAMLVMFGFVSIQGMQILARVDFANNEHNFLIAAVSIAAGVGLNNSNLFNSLPTAFQMFFSNGIVVASLLAIVLNAILNHNKKEK